MIKIIIIIIIIMKKIIVISLLRITIKIKNRRRSDRTFNSHTPVAYGNVRALTFYLG